MTADTQDADRRWFKRFGHRDQPGEIRLLCFHHAGGSAGMYRQWPQLLPPSVELVAVQLPGRADRFGEPPFDRMEPLIDALVEALKPLLERPFACYGVSMGARVAWALAHTLRERSMPMPRWLFVACDTAPSEDDGTWPWQNRPDGLEGYMRQMGGTPAAVFAEPVLLQALLPTLRADLDVLSTHQFRPAQPLEIPIRGFAGVRDPAAPPHRMAAWRQETTAGFDLDLLPCGHFFDPAAEHRVIQTIGQNLTRAG